MGLIEDPAVDVALRCSALDAMAELGSRAFEAQGRLLALLPKVTDDAMLGSLAHALVAIAPSSAPVSAVLLERLKQTGVDSPLFVDLVEACRDMGPAAAEGQSEFMRGLAHSDVYTRTKCLVAIRQTGTSDPSMIQALVDRIVDPNEEVSVKKLASESLARLGLPGQQAIADRLTVARLASDQASMLSLLRAMTVIGGQTESVADTCLALLNDAKSDLDLRTAAATALGSVRPVSPIVVPVPGQAVQI